MTTIFNDILALESNVSILITVYWHLTPDSAQLCQTVKVQMTKKKMFKKYSKHLRDPIKYSFELENCLGRQIKAVKFQIEKKNIKAVTWPQVNMHGVFSDPILSQMC